MVEPQRGVLHLELSLSAVEDLLHGNVVGLDLGGRQRIEIQLTEDAAYTIQDLFNGFMLRVMETPGSVQ